ncbi:hypothetical protein HZS_6163, partial [Henneguya salminicola]
MDTESVQLKGGWAALTIWFKDSLDSKHVTFLTEFIQVDEKLTKFQTLAQFPITLELLKSSCIPKSLKAVAKLQHKPLQLAAKKLLISWKKYVKDTNESKNKKEIQNKGTANSSFLDSLSAAMDSTITRKRRVSASNFDSSISKKVTQTIIVEEQSIQPEIEITPVDNNDQENVTDVSLTKRRVSFKEDSLVEIFYFEMTDQERLEMHGDKPQLKFDEARHLESLEEKNAMKNAKILTEEKAIVVLWTKAVLIDDIVGDEKGTKSEEKENQQLIRESNILPPIFIDISKIPDTASEPSSSDSISKTDEELNISVITDESNILCIPYWDNFKNIPILPRKIAKLKQVDFSIEIDPISEIHKIIEITSCEAKSLDLAVK